MHIVPHIQQLTTYHYLPTHVMMKIITNKSIYHEKEFYICSIFPVQKRKKKGDANCHRYEKFQQNKHKATYIRDNSRLKIVPICNVTKEK